MVKILLLPMKMFVAKEALVLMLVSHRGHWKYPVGYVLIDQIKC